MRIGEIARRVGLRASAVRYYERLGLLPTPPRESGRRVYGESVIGHLQAIRFARDSGFTLREIATLIGGRPYSERLRRLARLKVEELEVSISRARTMQALLQKAMRCRCLTVEQCGRILRGD